MHLHWSLKKCLKIKISQNCRYTNNLHSRQCLSLQGRHEGQKLFLQFYKKFLKADVHPIVMKGIICRQLYGEYCDHRPSGDEDILIRKSEYEYVEKTLVENGYIPEKENVTLAQLEDAQEKTFLTDKPD